MSRPISSSAVGTVGARPSDRPHGLMPRILRACKRVVRDPVAWVLLSPAAWVALFWGFMLVATMVNGGWPHAHHGWPGSPEWDDVSIDPKQLGPLAAAVYLGILALIVTVPLGVAQCLVAIFRPKLRRAGLMYAAFLVGGFLTYATLWLDPLGAMSWFVD